MHWMLYLIPECCFPGDLKQNHLANNISIYMFTILLISGTVAIPGVSCI